MKQLDTYFVDGIGEVVVSRSARARRVSIRLKPFGGVKLVLPVGHSIDAGMRFVEKNREWIRKSQVKISQKENKLTIFDESTEFTTRSFTLKIVSSARKDVSLVYGNGQLLVTYPQVLSVEDDGVQEAIRFGIEEALRREAKAFLPGRLAWLARKHGFVFSGVAIKNLKSRWGSCSTAGNINLNLHLMRLPDHLIDYVLLHELCHTKEHNHGAGFWRLLDVACEGKAKQLDNEMRSHQTKIY